jgi:hypothetical protein
MSQVTERIAQERRSPGSRVVTRAGPFDLDDVGAEIGQGLRAPGAREHARQVQDTDAGK